MPLWTPQERLSFVVDNWGADPSTTPGTSVVPGASDAEGSWTQVLGALGQDVTGFYLLVTGGGTASNIKSHLLDVGVDPAGGSSYTAILSNLVCGASSVLAGGTGLSGMGLSFYFPLRIRAGSTVAVRIQGSNATAGTVRVAIRAWGQPDLPHLWPVGQYTETIGTITGSQGVSFTPGNAADGSWASLGSTTRELWWWQIGYQISNGTITSETTYIEIAYGDATNKHVICRLQHIGNTNEYCGNVMPVQLIESYCRVPAGSNLYIRGRCNNAPDTGYNGVAVGVGG
jgi:hypothetical protein